MPEKQSTSEKISVDIFAEDWKLIGEVMTLMHAAEKQAHEAFRNKGMVTTGNERIVAPLPLAFVEEVARVAERCGFADCEIKDGGMN